MRVTFSNGYQIEVPDLSCHTMRGSMFESSSLIVRNCSADPLVNGTSLTFVNSQTGANSTSTFAVSSINTASQYVDWFSSPVVLQVLMVCTIAFAFMLGLNHGDRV